MRILNRFRGNRNGENGDIFTKAQGNLLTAWNEIGALFPNNGDLIAAVSHDGNVICGAYKDYYIFTAGRKDRAILAFDKWSLIKPYIGPEGWRRFSLDQYPIDGERIIAVSHNFDKCAMASFNRDGICSSAMAISIKYEYWEVYPNAER